MSWDGKILKELEGLPGGRAWFAITLLSGRVGICVPERIGILDQRLWVVKMERWRTKAGVPFSATFNNKNSIT
jgi:hypothetical protein